MDLGLIVKYFGIYLVSFRFIISLSPSYYIAIVHPFIHSKSPFPISFTFNKHSKNAKYRSLKSPLSSLWKEASLCRPQNRLPLHRHDINNISHRAHIVRNHNIKRRVSELSRRLAISHHIAFAGISPHFTLRSHHVVHVVGTVHQQAANIHHVVQRLHLPNANGRRAAAGRNSASG